MECQFLSHRYDSTPKKSRRKRDSNPGCSALAADALPLGQRGGQSGGKASAARAADLGSIPAFVMDLFPGRVKPVASKLATLPGASCYWASAGAGWHGVSVLCDWER